MGRLGCHCVFLARLLVRSRLLHSAACIFDAEVRESIDVPGILDHYCDRLCHLCQSNAYKVYVL